MAQTPRVSGSSPSQPERPAWHPLRPRLWRPILQLERGRMKRHFGSLSSPCWTLAPASTSVPGAAALARRRLLTSWARKSDGVSSSRLPFSRSQGSWNYENPTGDARPEARGMGQALSLACESMWSKFGRLALEVLGASLVGSIPSRSAGSQRSR